MRLMHQLQNETAALREEDQEPDLNEEGLDPDMTALQDEDLEQD